MLDNHAGFRRRILPRCQASALLVCPSRRRKRYNIRCILREGHEGVHEVKIDRYPGKFNWVDNAACKTLRVLQGNFGPPSVKCRCALCDEDLREAGTEALTTGKKLSYACNPACACKSCRRMARTYLSAAGDGAHTDSTTR
jgi:hypothetical protein